MGGIHICLKELAEIGVWQGRPWKGLLFGRPFSQAQVCTAEWPRSDVEE